MERPIASFVRHTNEIRLEIPLADGHAEPVWAQAEIVYDSFDALQHGTAVRFKSMSARDQNRIDAVLARGEHRPPARASSNSAAA